MVYIFIVYFMFISFPHLKVLEKGGLIIQLYNPAKFIKWKNKYIIQFFEVKFPDLHSLFWKVSP